MVQPLDSVGMDSGLFSRHKTSFQQTFATPVEAFKNYCSQVDRYDDAASNDPGFMASWATRFGKWSARSTAAMLIDSHRPIHINLNEPSKTSNPFFQEAYQRQHLYSGCTNYFKILGLKEDYLEKDKALTWKEFLSHKDFKAGLYGQIKDNFSESLKPRSIDFSAYLKNTVYKYNLSNILKPIAEKGYWGSSCSSILAMGLSLYGIVPKTLNAFKHSKSEGNGFCSSSLSAGITFAKEAFKSLFCWEVGSAGFAIGAALLPLGPIPRLVAGWAMGSLIGTVVSKGINKVIPQELTS